MMSESRKRSSKSLGLFKTVGLKTRISFLRCRLYSPGLMHTKAFGEYISDSKVPVNVYVAKRINTKDLA